MDITLLILSVSVLILAIGSIFLGLSTRYLNKRLKIVEHICGKRE